MQTKKRWLQSVIKASETVDTQMPWERGARREEFIARRTAKIDEPQRLSA